MSESKLASNARVIMIDPVHQQLPRIVLHIQATCNCFDHNHVLHQWLFFDALTGQHLDPILGPAVGKSSDGDSRRRKFHLAQSSDQMNGERFKPISIEDSFLLSARREGELVKDLLIKTIFTITKN